MSNRRFFIKLITSDFVWVVKNATKTHPSVEYCIGLFFNDGTIYKNKVRVSEETREEIPMYIWKEIAKHLEKEYC